MPPAWADAAPWCSHVGYADDLILVATSPKGRRIPPEKLQFWSNFTGSHDCVCGQNLQVEASMVFLGARSYSDRTDAVGDRVGMAWTNKSWATNRQWLSARSEFAGSARRDRSRDDLGLRRWGIRHQMWSAEPRTNSGPHVQIRFASCFARRGSRGSIGT